MMRSRGGVADFSRGKTLSRPAEKPSLRADNRRLILRRRKIGGFFLALATISLLILIFLTQFVANISVVGTDGKVLDKKYATSIEKYYQKQPFERLISQLKKGDLLTSVQQEFPEVEEISKIEFSGFGKYKFSLKMRRAVAVWEISGKNLYVDENGVAFEQNFSPAPSLKIVDEGISRAGGGTAVAGAGFMKFIGRIISSSNSVGLKITDIKIPANTLRQIEAGFEGVEFRIKFSTVESSDGQIQSLQKSIKFFAEKGVKPQYLDLRVEGKGYYK